MIKLITDITDIIHKHGKLAAAALIISIICVWRVPTVRDSVLSVIGIGTQSNQKKTAETLASLEAYTKENGIKTGELETAIGEIRHFQLMSIITNEMLPVSLRLDAYDEYTAAGYNSWVHLYYEKELEPLGKDVMSYRLGIVGTGGKK